MNGIERLSLKARIGCHWRLARQCVAASTPALAGEPPVAPQHLVCFQKGPSVANEVRPVWTPAEVDALARQERLRAHNYPISRWYLRPLAGAVSRYLAHSPVRPWHVTLSGFACTLGAATVIWLAPLYGRVAALLILIAWFCDRLDGQLARRQGTATTYGAWLDGNLDELGDLTVHTAFAAAAAAEWGGFAWWLWGAFVAGKYLFMYGLAAEEQSTTNATNSPGERNLLQQLYHLPANADVRIHLALAAAYCGGWTIELGAIAAYYQLRWIARYVLVARHLRREAT